MRTTARVAIMPLMPLLLSVACNQEPAGSSTSDARDTRAANAGIDSLNVRLVQAYRTKDPQAYARLYTDSGVFEWPAFNTVRGHAALEALARGNFAPLQDVDLQLTVASRQLAPNYATEFGAFQESWRDSSGTRMTEFGRYVAGLARQKDKSWRIDHFVGFSDSTRSLPARR